MNCKFVDNFFVIKVIKDSPFKLNKWKTKLASSFFAHTYLWLLNIELNTAECFSSWNIVILIGFYQQTIFHSNPVDKFFFGRRTILICYPICYWKKPAKKGKKQTWNSKFVMRQFVCRRFVDCWYYAYSTLLKIQVIRTRKNRFFSIRIAIILHHIMWIVDCKMVIVCAPWYMQTRRKSRFCGCCWISFLHLRPFGVFAKKVLMALALKLSSLITHIGAFFNIIFVQKMVFFSLRRTGARVLAHCA